jgi:hypothetical protein
MSDLNIDNVDTGISTAMCQQSRYMNGCRVLCPPTRRMISLPLSPQPW